MNAQTESPTRLHGRWLLIARITWVALAILTLTIVVIALPARYDSLMLNRVHYTAKHSLEQLGLSIEFYTAYNLALDILRVLVSTVVALFIVWRKSDDWMALFVSLTLLFVGPFWISASYSLTDALIKFHPALLPVDYWDLAVEFLRAVSWGCFILFFYLFPNGRLLFPWMRVLAVWILTWPFFPAMRPYAWSSIDPLTVFLILFGLGVWTQIYRYSRLSSSLERQQTKWAIFGLAIAISIPFAVYLLATINLSLWLPSRAGLVYFLVGDTLITLSSLLIPLTISNSILRYRLWDIDIIINRALVYGVLTTGVVGLYILIVGWSSIGLQTQNNLAGSVFAILMIAFLFRPLRQRVQRIADRFVPLPQTASPSEQHKHQITISEKQGAADTALRGYRLFLARVFWVLIALLSISIFILGTVAQYDRIREPCSGVPLEDQPKCWPTEDALHQLGLTWEELANFYTPIATVAVLPIILIGCVVFWRKSETKIGLLFSLALVAGGSVSANQDLIVDLFHAFPNFRVPITFIHFLSNTAPGMFLCLFPDGRFVPRWTRWLLILWAADVLAVSISNFLIPSFGNSIWRQLLDPPGMILLIIVGIYAFIFRYRHDAGAVQRQQIKWIIMAMVVLNIFMIGFKVLGLFWQPGFVDLFIIMVYSPLWYLGALFGSICIGISIFRYRLWDIDIIINRTLVYGALTGIIVTAFIVMVGLLSLLFQSSGNSIVAIVATGLVALLFNPLRQRLQRGVNHLMYGERDDPYVVLSRLGRRLETTLAPEAMLPIIVTTVRECLKLPYAALYLKQEDSDKIVAESASPLLRIENGKIRVPGMEREGLCMPLVHQGETLGYIVLGPRAPNEAFNATDLRLLEDLAPQVGVAVHAVRLTADLQRSRERLVRAREEERRRLRRDLHDGLGPQLAGLALKLETLRNRLNGDPLADSLLADLAKRTQDATADIRHLVYELRPPTLDELGLVSALRESTTQYSQQGNNGVNIRFDAPESLPPLPAAVEVAVYRISQEALTNVIRHAEARTCVIRLKLDEFTGFLCLEVQDDGSGMPMKRRAGVGLNSMQERAEELGGRLTVTSLTTGGTLLTASLPCRVSNVNTGESS